MISPACALSSKSILSHLAHRIWLSKSVVGSLELGVRSQALFSSSSIEAFYDCPSLGKLASAISCVASPIELDFHSGQNLTYYGQSIMKATAQDSDTKDKTIV